MKRTYIYLLLVLCALMTQGLFAFGSKEKEETGLKDSVQTEEKRRISLVLVSSSPADQGSIAGSLAGEASLFLFQEYTVSETGVKISSSRRFSMPVESRKQIGLSGVPLAVEYELELIPSAPRAYRMVRELEVVFPAEELVSSGRVRLQPGRRALLEAAKKSGMNTGLIRIKSMEYKRRGDIVSLVEIARSAD